MKKTEVFSLWRRPASGGSNALTHPWLVIAGRSPMTLVIWATLITVPMTQCTGPVSMAVRPWDPDELLVHDGLTITNVIWLDQDPPRHDGACPCVTGCHFWIFFSPWWCPCPFVPHSRPAGKHACQTRPMTWYRSSDGVWISNTLVHTGASLSLLGRSSSLLLLLLLLGACLRFPVFRKPFFTHFARIFLCAQTLPIVQVRLLTFLMLISSALNMRALWELELSFLKRWLMFRHLAQTVKFAHASRWGVGICGAATTSYFLEYSLHADFYFFA